MKQCVDMHTLEWGYMLHEVGMTKQQSYSQMTAAYICAEVAKDAQIGDSLADSPHKETPR